MKLSKAKFGRPKNKVVSVHYVFEGADNSFGSFFRDVNAVYDEKGKYDKAATVVRVDEVGHGLAVKIAAGAIELDDSEDYGKMDRVEEDAV